MSQSIAPPENGSPGSQGSSLAMRLLGEGVVAIRSAVAEGHITAVQMAQAALNRIATSDEPIRAFVRVDADGALRAAAKVDAAMAAGEPVGLLAGVPVGIKDQIVTLDLETTAASAILKGFVPPYDATVVARFRAAGAVVVGKNNQDEFAMGSSSETSCYGACANPWDIERVPGGSSGGSAAAVALRQVPLSLGTDTGGSVRQPASLCGVVGLKPSYGRVSRYGAIAFASSLDQIGPLTTNVPDAALALQVIAGPDPRDSTCSAKPTPDYLGALDEPPAALRVGVPREYFSEGIDPDVRHAVETGLDRLRAAGAKLVDVSLPHVQHSVATYYLIATAEASSNLARYDGVRYGRRAEGVRDADELMSRSRAEGFGLEVKRRIMLGTFALSSGYHDAYYGRAQRVRTLIARDFQSALAEVDVIVSPTSPVVAFKRGELLDNPLQMYLMDIFTLAANLAGICAISVPCGQAGGLPVGLQLMARPFAEALLLRVARQHELRYPNAALQPPTPGRCQ